MKCPTCGKETKGRDHNGRGLRCTSCWALLPDEPSGRLPTEAELAAVLTEAKVTSKPRRRRKTTATRTA